MRKILTAILCLLPIGCFAQFVITGRILNQVDTKPVSNAGVFLNKATIGSITDNQGNFRLVNVRPGKYDIVISVLGFEISHQAITVANRDTDLNDIIIFPKTIILNEVKIKAEIDPDWKNKFELFKKGFLGVSSLASECNILNPEVLNLKYNRTKDTLLAASNDFLEIENNALGYKLKYMLAKFSMQIKDENSVGSDIDGNVKLLRGDSFLAAKEEKISSFVHYEGSVLFQQLDGAPEQLNAWNQTRQEVYFGSQMHFLRAILNNNLEKEGFRVLQIVVSANPHRPRKSIETLMNYPLNRDELVRATDKAGLYAIGCDNDALYISYNKHNRFAKRQTLNDIDNLISTQNSIVRFNGPHAFFGNNGGEIINPNSLRISGAWGRARMAELLPVDYEPLVNTVSKADHPDIISKIQEYANQHFVEKAYLHFDKPYYAAGDTIFFKAYLVMGERHQPSTISSVLCVDLINTNNKISQSIKLQISKGVAVGDFALPDTLQTGNYQVRAYTKWMFKNGDESYFYQTIPVSALSNKTSAPAITRIKTSKPDIQFFPEGGVLVAGISSKIAFKAIDKNGLGIDAKGIITNEDNNEITNFTSSHLGMGSLELLPKLGKTYHAKLTYPDGTESDITIPIAVEKGITLAINNDSLPKASVKIEANKEYYRENKNKVFSLLIYSEGTATAVNCTLDSAVITLDIIKRRLHTGIARVTLFSPTHEPLRALNVCSKLRSIKLRPKY